MSAAPPVPLHVMWHEVECGRYEADLPLWRELARGAPDGVLDVGAGTGRVALRLAHAGHRVTALDIDPLLLSVLDERAQAARLDIETVVADAASFTLEHSVGLVIVPMQTLQLLPARAGFFASARRALVPGGRVAAAIAGGLEEFDDLALLPTPDMGECEGWTFVSQPIAIRGEQDGFRIERIRQVVAPDGERTTSGDVIHLAAVTPAGLAEEAAAQGLEAEDLLWIPETDEHVGSEVAVFRA